MNNLFPQIYTSRLLLRQFMPVDIDHVFRGLSHAAVIKYYGISYPSLQATQAQMDWFDYIFKNNTGIWWVICSPDGNTFYGACGFNNMVATHKKAELGYWLLPEYWGKGIVTEAVKAICDHALTQMNIYRIESQIETENSNSIAVMHKLGFVLEGTLHAFEWKNNRAIDLHIYALLKKDD